MAELDDPAEDEELKNNLANMLVAALTDHMDPESVKRTEESHVLFEITGDKAMAEDIGKYAQLLETIIKGLIALQCKDGDWRKANSLPLSPTKTTLAISLHYLDEAMEFGLSGMPKSSQYKKIPSVWALGEAWPLHRLIAACLKKVRTSGLSKDERVRALQLSTLTGPQQKLKNK